MFKFLWSRIKKFDHYQRAILFSLPISLLLLFYLFPELLLDEWLLELMSIPAFIGSIVSGSTYIGRIFDYLKQPAGKAERAGTVLGALFGVGVAIAMAILEVTIPFTDALYVIADAVFTLNMVNSFSGLGNRLGTCVDKGSRSKSEKLAMGITAFFAAAVSVFLIAMGLTAGVSIVGITTFFTGGAALPFWISGILFAVSFTSTLTSTADYSSKTVNFIRSTYPEKKFHEYRGSCIGVGVGVAIGLIIVAAVVISQPYLLAGIIGIAAAMLVVTTCASVIGGLFSRMGRFKDKCKSIDENDKLAVNDTLAVTVNEQPTNTSDKSLIKHIQKKEALPLNQDRKSSTFVKKVMSPKEKRFSSNPYLLMPQKKKKEEENLIFISNKKFNITRSLTL